MTTSTKGPLVTVYSKPRCVQCDATYRALDKCEIPYRKIDVSENPEFLLFIGEELGYMQAPVVFVEDGTGENHWSGFRPDRIKALKAALES